MPVPAPSEWTDALRGALPLAALAPGQVDYFFVSPAGRYVACTTHALHTVLIDTAQRRYAVLADWSVRGLDDASVELESDETRRQAFPVYADLWQPAFTDPALQWQSAKD
ncbi:hypothetical protein LJR129_000521 [Acidovorax sp. LjRoot129]|uniref:hypothetical protein n=1 Tax=Acidovorax sp. LjRoot129 TaxID=3342260 RepID=UPI003ECC8871